MNEVEIKFKSNIKCEGCIAKVKPFLDELTDLDKWEVDTLTPNKILTVKGTEGIEEQVITAVKAAGYTIDKIEE
jgi:copper chaperone